MKALNKTGLLFSTLLVLLISTGTAWAQCPPNIGFESGNFDYWKCFDGSISDAGIITMHETPAISGKHTIFANQGAAIQKDFYGDFPVNCPNGSGYSIMLGNNGAGREAQSVQYSFTVPDVKGDYSIMYYYAVVFQNPRDHSDIEQPKFEVKLFNVTDNEYVNCGSFQFISAPNLPGFEKSTKGQDVYYKEWAPITLKLPGFVGKTLRLEFTVNDCTKGGHFGYAYLDINENCTSPIRGNVFCNDKANLKLTAPYGFQDYTWYSEDFSTVLGKGNILHLRPTPPTGTRLALEIIPYPNQGCQDTLYTTITRSNEELKLVVKDSIQACSYEGGDITQKRLFTGSTPGLSFEYFTDLDETRLVQNPKGITFSGTYYIRASNAVGCSESESIGVYINPTPELAVTKPPPECIPAIVDLTSPTIASAKEPGTVLTYWRDKNATQTLVNPQTITAQGEFFIKAVSTNGCFATQSVSVDITPKPSTVVKDLWGCDQLFLANMQPTVGSDPIAAVTYFSDASARQELLYSHVFTQSVTYYIKFTNPWGCAVVKPAQVTIYPSPKFVAQDPPMVRLPQTVDITSSVPPSPTWSYSYWKNRAATEPLTNPTRIIASGQFFIKATSLDGCTTLDSVDVKIEDAIIIPPNIITPNGDGIHDTWSIPLLQYYPNASMEIYNRTGQQVYRIAGGYSKDWDGKSSEGKPLPPGTYYYILKFSPKHKPQSGSVTIVY